ncbi:hypothetical protein OSC27_14355 [Microbacterium sp. STN6]|uniref:hypothetical protein n=1 Tax=Microbacterium sp. STN6 TaxID=2995588 RepID=UPI002260DB05|nr:hypothetical protein [Microbacterium sp. STN6]MCX7523454.1 hypothetical protein [Microbacterium sp. STN6]
MSEERKRGHRRVQRPGAAGADPEPQRMPGEAAVRASADRDESFEARGDSNDRRLRDDVPPHWG